MRTGGQGEQVRRVGLPVNAPPRIGLERGQRRLTGDALSLLVHGVVRRAGGVGRAAGLLGLLAGRRLDELDGRLEDAELQCHGHLFEGQEAEEEALCDEGAPVGFMFFFPLYLYKLLTGQ